MPTAIRAECELDYAPDLGAILGPLRRGRTDPAFRFAEGRWWRAAQTPQGPVLQRLGCAGAVVESVTWGPGARWQADRLADLFAAGRPVEEALDERIDAALPTRSGVPPLSRRLRGWRAPATGNVWDALVAAVLEQRVTGREARSAWARLLADHGSPVPGPAPGGMIAPPTFDAIRMVPSWWWRRAGVDRQRSDTLVRLSRLRHVVERLPDVNHAESRRLLTAVPGVGVWTHAEVAQRALGDDDSVSVGDFHLAGQIVYAFTGGWAGTDEQMLELLEPFAGHRYRVVRAVELAGISRPRRGPRMPVPPRVRG